MLNTRIKKSDYFSSTFVYLPFWFLEHQSASLPLQLSRL
ncbi:unnamed protein product [Arabidopsis halleri]